MIMKNRAYKEDLIKKISEKYPMYDRKVISKFYNIMFDMIKNELLEGNDVNISNFGTFNIREKKEKKIHSIDGSIKNIPEHKTISFTISRDFKNKLN